MDSLYLRYGSFAYVKRLVRAFCGHLYTDSPLKENIRSQHSNLYIFENNQRKFFTYLMGGPNMLENQPVGEYHFALGLTPPNAHQADEIFKLTLSSSHIESKDSESIVAMSKFCDPTVPKNILPKSDTGIVRYVSVRDGKSYRIINQQTWNAMPDELKVRLIQHPLTSILDQDGLLIPKSQGIKLMTEQGWNASERFLSQPLEFQLAL